VKSRPLTQRNPPLTLIILGLALGLLLTALTWGFPTFAVSLFAGPTWLWLLLLTGAFLALVAVRLLLAEPAGRAQPRPLYLLAMLAATALVYLFPELFAPGCNGMPRAFAACPAACRITTCTDWDAPGENGCNAKPPNKGCCRSYETTCAPDCGDPGDPGDPGNPPPPTYQPPTITGSISCANPGANGWCLGGAVLNLNAADPQGFATTIAGDIAGAAFSCAGPGCLQGLPAGSGSIHFQASAPTSGLSSGVGSAAFAFDPTPPTAQITISGMPGENGWYTSASVSTTGADGLSGIASTQIAVDGGGWQTSAALPEGIHSVIGRASDNAGHVATTPPQIVKVDATPPVITASVTFGELVAGWYVTDVTLTANAFDTTSGLALIESRLDDGAWSPSDSLVVTSEGSHKIDFRAIDQAGLRSTTSVSLQVDRTPPSTSFTPTGTFGTGGWYISPVSLIVNAADLLSGVASIETRLNGGDWTPSSKLALGDGEHTVEARATDNAGNLSAVSAAETIGIRVDTTAPSLTTTLTGESGLASWYVSAVTVSATAADATSGIALTEYRLDNGGWQVGTSLTVSADGSHKVDFRTTDRAGNQTFASRTFKIDQTLPLSKFVSPADGSSGVLAMNLFTLEGQATDVTSGLAMAQISTDNGLTWLDLPVTAGGSWLTTWETRPFPNGLYPVLVRVQDVAGNVQNSAQVTLLLANHPPKVSIQESWWVWEAGQLKVQERFLPVGEIQLRIACLDGQPDVKLKFTLETLPSALSWDRKCGQGQFATSGNHLVTLTACDQVGNCASATGTIKVPFIAPPVPTWTPTSTAIIPTATPTIQPSQPPRKPTATATQARVTLPTPLPPVETPVKPPAPAGWLWPSAALMGLWLALGLSSVLDHRPAALKHLLDSWQTIASQTPGVPESLKQ
jgi:hypothetical protein